MPREDIEVEINYSPTGVANGTGQYDATVRDGNSRAWSGSGSTPGAAATEATRKFLGDRRAREYVG